MNIDIRNRDILPDEVLIERLLFLPAVYLDIEFIAMYSVIGAHELFLLIEND